MPFVVDQSVDISHVAGNAPEEVKRTLVAVNTLFKQIQTKGPIFGEEIQKRMVVTEISIVPKAEEPKKKEGKVVVEMDVAEGA